MCRRLECFDSPLLTVLCHLTVLARLVGASALVPQLAPCICTRVYIHVYIYASYHIYMHRIIYEARASYHTHPPNLLHHIIYIYIYICTASYHIYIYTYIPASYHIYTCTYVHVYMIRCMYIDMIRCRYVYMYVYKCIYIYISYDAGAWDLVHCQLRHKPCLDWQLILEDELVPFGNG